MTTNTYFRVESISKSVTAWGVMKLVEQGGIGLDNSVEQYMKNWEFPASEISSEKVTVRQLLSNSAGMPLGNIFKRYSPKTQTDPRTDAAGYPNFNIHAYITVPFHRAGALKYLFSVNTSTARDWHTDEIELIREVAHLTFQHLERAKAEAVLRKSNRLQRCASSVQWAWHVFVFSLIYHLWHCCHLSNV